MKKFKKLMALVIAMVMVVAMTTMTAFAADDGSIIVTNATAGQTYEAFLIFTANPSNPNDVTNTITYTATPAQVDISGFDTYFDKALDEDGNYTISKKSTAADNDVISWVKTNIDSLKQGNAIPGTFENKTTVKFSDLAYGYYYITSTLGTLVTIDTAGKNIEVVDKNESTPTGPDKEITAEDNEIDTSLDQTDVSLKQNDTSVGSVETFTVTFNATNWVQAVETNNAGTGDATTKKKALVWHFKDTPTGLAIDADSVVVKVNGDQDITSTIKNKAVNSTTGVLTFDIPWVDNDENFLYETKTSGSALIPVTVTYNATITADAAIAPAPNTVEVKYDRTGEQDVDLGDDTTTTYTYKFKIEKVDENSSALDGAEFELYFGTQADDSATALTFTLENGAYRYDPESSETHIVATNGEATVIGLDNASYMLREVVVPKGYNKTADKAVTSLTKEDTGEEASITTITVQNLKGTELPSTGGMGTTIFYVIGAILVLGAGVVLVTRRRMNAN